MNTELLIQIKKRLMCILTLFIFLIFIVARLLNSFAHESAFRPVLMMARRRWRPVSSLTASFTVVCVRLCICVRAKVRAEEQCQQNHQSEPGLSHTGDHAFCSTSCVYAVRYFVIWPHQMIRKSGSIKLVLAHLNSHQTWEATKCIFSNVM